MLDKELSEKKSSSEQLLKENQTLEERLAGAQSDVKSWEEKCHKEEEENEKLNKEIRDLAAMSSSSNSTLEQVQSENAKLTSKITKLDKTRENMESWGQS